LKKSIIIDADPQANASSGLGIDVESVDSTFRTQSPPKEAIVKCSAPNVDIPSY
jgi:chromosome partitioning protein